MPEAPGRAGQSVSCPACGKRVTVSGAVFDPYYTWLGIPPPEQPPNFYRLLGLQLFENNPQVIQNAADRQMRHLQSIQAGAHAAHSQRLLNEIALARTCLLNPTNKAVYDQQLTATLATQHLGRPIGSPVPIAPPPPPSAPNAPAVPSLPLKTKPPETQPSKPAPRQRKQNSLVTTIGIVLGGVMGLAMGAMVVFYFTGMDVLGYSAKERWQAERPSAPDIPRTEPFPKNKKKEQPRQANLPERPPPTPFPIPPGQPAEPIPDPTPPTAAPPIEPQRPTLLFANLSRAIELPPPMIDAPAMLFSLTREPVETLNLAIHSELADIPPTANIAIDVKTPDIEWIVYFLPDDRESARRFALARIRRDGHVFSFDWAAPSVESPIRAQLANCVLQLECGNESRVVQLRNIISLPPLLLDLSKEKQAIDIQLDHLPLANRLVLKILKLDRFTREAVLRNDLNAINLGKSAFIDFKSMKGPEIEVRLFKPASSGKLSVRIDAQFKENGKSEIELTFASLDEKLGIFRNRLSTLQSNLAAKTQAIVAAKSRLAALELQWTQATTFQEKTSLQGQIGATRLTINSLSQDKESMERQLPALQSRVTAAPDLRRFMDDHHQTASIAFAICATAGNKEIVLAESE